MDRLIDAIEGLEEITSGELETPVYSSAALEASKVIKASPGSLRGATAFNNNASTRYFQVFNSATVPANGEVPMLTIPVPAGKSVSFDGGLGGLVCSAGISVCGSTTAPTKTVGGADFLFTIKYT